MNRRTHTWRVQLLGSNSRQEEVTFTTYWSPEWPAPDRAAEAVANAAAASATVAAQRKVVYAGVAAVLEDAEE